MSISANKLWCHPTSMAPQWEGGTVQNSIITPIYGVGQHTQKNNMQKDWGKVPQGKVGIKCDLKWKCQKIHIQNFIRT